MSDLEPEVCEYELLRLKNVEENLKKMRELGLISVQEKKPREPRLKGRRVKRKELPRRRSARIFIASFSREVAFCALGDEIDPTGVSVTWGEGYGDDDDDVVLQHHAKSIETIIDSDDESQATKRNSFYGGYLSDDESHESKRRKRNVKQGVEEREVPSVEDITDEHLENIANFVKDKIYSPDGTTCHQCRQKTLDQKTVCRSAACFGVRGQFCGPCLKNRYGEEVAAALKSASWTCPPCREICNCSICRTQKGKAPTGQLTYAAQQNGYCSVRQYLEEKFDV
ncbi:cell division cycle-associated protein 7-like [Homalodisca vitripennis]|uniref:cell division cycle-associated protein 7-like n=1 Tax=Homalodisca vitripennis TaxID=197043 RepID=UPI001EECAAE8|nr:cell division cycle-associated protein 7-like [Homalodisca vitripennis]